MNIVFIWLLNIVWLSFLISTAIIYGKAHKREFQKVFDVQEKAKNVLEESRQLKKEWGIQKAELDVSMRNHKECLDSLQWVLNFSLESDKSKTDFRVVVYFDKFGSGEWIVEVRRKRVILVVGMAKDLIVAIHNAEQEFKLKLIELSENGK